MVIAFKNYQEIHYHPGSAPSSRDQRPSAPSLPSWNPPRKNGPMAPGLGILYETPAEVVKLRSEYRRYDYVT